MQKARVQHLLNDLERYHAAVYEAERNGDTVLEKKYKRLVRQTLRAIERKQRPPTEAALSREQKKLDKKRAKDTLRVEKALAKQRQKAQEAAKAPREPAKGRKPLKQGKPLPKVNKTRAAAASEARFSHADGYSAYIHALHCFRCHRHGTEFNPIEFAHMKGVDLGGKAEDGLPLCRECHRWQETHKKQFDDEFTEREGLTPLQMAHALRAAYLLERGADDERPS